MKQGDSIASALTKYTLSIFQYEMSLKGVRDSNMK